MRLQLEHSSRSIHDCTSDGISIKGIDFWTTINLAVEGYIFLWRGIPRGKAGAADGDFEGAEMWPGICQIQHREKILGDIYKKYTIFCIVQDVSFRIDFRLDLRLDYRAAKRE